ncbi:MAG: ThuA domain-containing protein [Polyangiaceae bacterium]
MRTFAICAVTLAVAGVLGSSLVACSDGSNGLMGLAAGAAGSPSAGASTTNGGSPATPGAGSGNVSSMAGTDTTPTGGTGNGTGGTADPGGGGMPQAGGAPPAGGTGDTVGGAGGTAAGGTAAGGAAAGGSGGGGVVSGPFKILIVSTALEFAHDSIPDCQQMISDLGKTDPNNPWTTKVETDDLADFTDAGLKDYGMVFFCSPTGRVFSGNSKVANKAGAMTAFQNFIEKDGKAFGGIHSASDFEKTNGFPWFTNTLMGAYFQSHGGPSDPGTVVSDTTNKSHPILAGLAATYSTSDEWYVMNRDPSTQPGFKIVQRLAVDSRPLTWVKEVGAGRMFNTVRGHNKSVYKEEPFRTVVKNGILWTTKRVN